MKQALCDVCAEPIWAEEDERPLCMEHLFTEEFPALAKLTDQAREQEQRGPNRQEENRAATTETPIERNSVMEQSTAPEIYGYTTERYNAETYEYDTDQHTLKRQSTLRVQHLQEANGYESPVHVPSEHYWHTDFHLYRTFINGEEVIGKTLVAVDAETGQQLAQLQLSLGHFADLAIWLNDQFSDHVESRRKYNEMKAEREQESGR